MYRRRWTRRRTRRGLLARVAEFVPGTIPVTTLVLGPDTQRSLVRLLRAGNYGAVVADQQLLAHCRRLRRELQRESIREVPVTLAGPVQPQADPVASQLSRNTQADGAPIAEAPAGTGDAPHVTSLIGPSRGSG